MELIKLYVPAAYLQGRDLSWCEVRFGLVNELLDRRAAIDFAAEQLAREPSSSETLTRLAQASDAEEVRTLVDKLADAESHQTEAEVRAKWLIIVLGWIYEHRDAYPDPLQKVEEVYADFGYPEAIAGFVRYMPMDGPDLGSRAANEQRLFERWKRFLDERTRAER